MPALPEKVSQAWEDKEGPIILSTVNGDGIPNAIYVSCASLFSEDMIVVANNKFSKTLENILSGSRGSILFITKEGKSYQIKGSIEYYKEGSIFEDMKQWNPKQDLGFGAAALKVEEVYTGAEKLV
jgi:predicted pyridoxine 5'-phosphate oxidase superfamily flavin-nucleotide-binding protein